MRRASTTSCSAVSRWTRPIERRYSRSESRLGSTVRSISTFLRWSGRGSAALAALASTLPPSDLRRAAVGLDDVDPVLVQVGVQLLDLLLGDLDLLEARRDLLEGQEAALLALGDQRPQLIELRDRSLIGQQHNSPYRSQPLSSSQTRS